MLSPEYYLILHSNREKSYLIPLKSRFSHCPIVWMFHSRRLNNRINNIHNRALRIIYQDYAISFTGLIAKDTFLAIYETDLQKLK